MRRAALALVVAMGCAGARVEAPGNQVFSAWAIGQGHASAGRCDRVASDVSESGSNSEHRETREDSRGELCAIASGGRGSVGLWASVAAGFGALVTLLAGAL